jgi:hypothetical protein
LVSTYHNNDLGAKQATPLGHTRDSGTEEGNYGESLCHFHKNKKIDGRVQGYIKRSVIPDLYVFICFL